MKLTLGIGIVMLVSIVTFASASENDAGYFIPRAFYTLDAEGHKSELYFVHPNTAHYLRRLRRSSSYTASSSSSSSTVSGSDGGPVYFSSLQTTQHTIEPDASAAGGSSSSNNGSGSSGSKSNARRTDGATTRGHVVHTVGMIDEKGRVQSRVSQGHF